GVRRRPLRKRHGPHGPPGKDSRPRARNSPAAWRSKGGGRTMSAANWTRRDLLIGGGAMLAAGAAGGPAEGGQAKSSAGDPPFKLGTVTYNVPKDWDFDTLCRILPQAGIGAVELRTTHAHGIEPSLNASQRAAAKKKAADAGLLLLSLGTTCEF